MIYKQITLELDAQIPQVKRSVPVPQLPQGKNNPGDAFQKHTVIFMVDRPWDICLVKEKLLPVYCVERTSSTEVQWWHLLPVSLSTSWCAPLMQYIGGEYMETVNTTTRKDNLTAMWIYFAWLHFGFGNAAVTANTIEEGVQSFQSHYLYTELIVQ